MRRGLIFLPFLAGCAPAFGGTFTVTYDDPKCAAFQTVPAGEGLTVSCKDGGTPPPGAPVCTPTATPSPSPVTSAGGTATLDAHCDPASGLTYSWTRQAPTVGTPLNANASIATDTLAPNSGAAAVSYQWQIEACSAPGVCDSKPASVTVPGVSTGPPVCAGFTATRNLNLGWPASGTSLTTQAIGGFRRDDALVIKITPPAGSVSIANQAGSISMAEYGDPLTTRHAVLSTMPCDFNGTSPYVVPAKQIATTISWSLQVGRKDSTGIVQLTAGTVYYLNVKNRSTAGTPTCSSGSCNMVINWLKPPTTGGVAKKLKKKKAS